MSIVGCDADYLKKRWDKLYDLRCKIAHNKSFNKTDSQDVEKLTLELKPYIQKALDNLDKVNLSEEERENIAENVVISLSEVYGNFIIKFRQLEKLIRRVSYHPNFNIAGEKFMTYGAQTIFLRKKDIITDEQYSDLKRIYYSRNDIVHGGDFSTQTLQEIKFSETVIEDLIQFFKLILRKTLDSNQSSLIEETI